MVDDTWASTISTNFSYGNIKFLIGKKHYETEVDSSFGSYTTHYPLWGQIEMIATRPAYCELSTLNTLINELKGLTKVSEFDELGMLKKVEIHECGKSILSNTYDYKKRSSNTKYISKQVSQETIKLGSSSYIRKYETDALGNITKITDNLFGNHTYKYDYRGFLIEADNETYEYDNNGNITKKGNLTATYDTTIKDRLVSFNGKDIEYDPINPLNPKYYGSNSYKFEGRRLVRWTYGGGYYDYIYNDQGLRIQKKDYRGVTWNYTYDGDKLIREKHLNTTLDFLYDENGNLYGFIKDNTDKYFYIRDALQNILGIVDVLGNIVVKYSYNAWGTTSITQDTSSSNIGNLNPFRYKGYYYDGQSGMYYCKTRYYVPLWGRWLNADSPTELNFEHINCLNLFSYALNDPINKYDPNGNFAISLIFLIGSIVGGAIYGGVMSGIKAYNEGERGADLVMDIVGGAFFGATVGATVALGGAAGLGAVAGSAVIGGTSLSLGSAIAISVGGMAIGSATKYSLDCAFSPREWSFSGYLTEFFQGGIQGLATFGLSYIGGKAGFFNHKIGKFSSWDSFYTGFGGMNSLKTMSYISNLIFGPAISKGIFVSGIGAIIRWAIDKLFPEF